MNWQKWVLVIVLAVNGLLSVARPSDGEHDSGRLVFMLLFQGALIWLVVAS